MPQALVAGVLGTIRVLFIGNSLTFWAGGLDGIFRRWGVNATSETVPGATLAKIWKAGLARARILEGGWHLVVLQDDLPEYKTDKASGERRRVVHERCSEALALFLEEVRRVGAEPVVFMAHPYERLKGTSFQDICWSHRLLQQSFEVVVAPGAVAHAVARDMGRQLLDEDGEHPSEEGLYLHALTIAAVCFGDDRLVELQWAPPALTDAEAALLKRVALDSLQLWSEQQLPLTGDLPLT